VIVARAVLTVGGENHDLELPDGEQIELTLDVEFDLASGVDYVMTLDVHAEQSVKKVGTNYLLTPVISVKRLETQS
jgi:hypothetical protein